MDVKEINKVLKEQFDELKANSQFKNEISTDITLTISDDKTTKFWFDSTQFDAPKFVQRGNDFLPRVHLTLSTGTLKYSEQFGQKVAEPTSVRIDGYVISVAVIPKASGGNLLFPLGAESGDFSFDNVSQEGGKYVFDRLRVDETIVDNLLDQLKTYFREDSFELPIPQSAMYTSDYDAMNTAASEYYKKRILNLPHRNNISVSASHTTPGMQSINRLRFEYSYPKVQFQQSEDKSSSGNNYIELVMLIAGTSQMFTKQGDASAVKSGDERTLLNTPMTCILGFEKVLGRAEDTGHEELQVVLDASKGAFRTADIHLDPNGQIQLAGNIRAHFVQNDMVFIINRLDVSEVNLLKDLKPNNFLFKMLKTPKGAKMLQLFIQTGERQLLHYTQTFLNNMLEPLPFGSQCSILIRSQLFFQSILPASVTQWTAVGRKIDRKRADSGWEASFTSAVVSAQIDLAGLNTEPDRLRYYLSKGNRLTWDLGGSDKGAQKLTPNPILDGSLELSGTKTQNFVVYFDLRNSGRWATYQHNQSAESNVRGTMRFSIDKGERDQNIAAAMSEKELSVSGHMSGGHRCGCDNLQAQVNQELAKTLPPKIEGALNVRLAPVSTFAVKNLLFYGKNVINLESAFAPGDLALFGNFTKPTS